MKTLEKRRFYNKKTVSDYMSRYTYISEGATDECIEVTEWVNGEGYDITIGDKSFSLSDAELEAIKHLVDCLMYDFKSEVTQENDEDGDFCD